MSSLSRSLLVVAFVLNGSLSFATAITIDFDSLALGEVLGSQYLPHVLFRAPPGEERLLEGLPPTHQRVTERLRATLGLDRAICPEATTVLGFAPADCSGILEAQFTRKATNVSFGILSDENQGLGSPPDVHYYNAWVLADVNGDTEFEMYAGVSTDGNLGTQDLVTLDGLDWWALESDNYMLGFFNPVSLPADGIYSLWIVPNHHPSHTVSLPEDDRIEPAGLLYDDLSWTFQDAEPPRDPQNIPSMKGPGIVADVPEPGGLSILGMAFGLCFLHKRLRQDTGSAPRQ